MRITPGYVQPGGPPLWLAAMSAGGAERAAGFDCHLLPPGPRDEQRLTLAVLYWLNATTSLRVGYAFSEPEGPDRDTFFLQASVGF